MNWDKFLGKRISVTSTKGMNPRTFGICTWIGYNENLDGVFQVTIERTPIFPVDPNDVRLEPEITSIFKNDDKK